jgi:hypothetical protein
MDAESLLPNNSWSMIPRLAYVEVEAVDANQSIGLNSAMVKQQLIDWSVQSLLCPETSSKFIVNGAVSDHHQHHREWKSIRVLNPNNSNGLQYDILRFESSDPLGSSSHIPVMCRGYVLHPLYPAMQQQQQVMVDEATLVRVVEPENDWKLQLTGEAPDATTDSIDDDNNNDGQQQRFFCCDESVRMQLKHRTIGRYMVGTAKMTTSQHVRASLNVYFHNNNNRRLRGSDHHQHGPPNNPILVIQLEHEVPSDDVVPLVKSTCCRSTDQCHVVRWGALRAKYGAYADWGLACAIHSIALSCAVRDRSCTIVLVDVWDRIDEDDGSRLRRYLERLIDAMKRHQTILYPDENPLYGMNHGAYGVRLAVRLNLIAIAAVGPNDRIAKRRSFAKNVDYIRIDRTPAIETRLQGLQYALANTKVDEGLTDPVPLRRLAEAMVWARGAVFDRIRVRLEAVPEETILSLPAFEAILGEFGPVMRCISSKQERAGGNDMAKQALYDAMNPELEIESLGLVAPTGILLYGPPGTGM